MRETRPGARPEALAGVPLSAGEGGGWETGREVSGGGAVLEFLLEASCLPAVSMLYFRDRPEKG